MLQAVADYRYFAEDLATAAKWYTQLFEFCPDELEAVYYFRYAQSLNSIGKIEKAKEMMDLFQSKKM
jgi:tetratricopeptide (TPR) repeat protein